MRDKPSLKCRVSVRCNCPESRMQHTLALYQVRLTLGVLKSRWRDLIYLEV